MWEFQSGENVPERVLWASVLRRTVFDYVLYKGKAKFELKWRKAHKFLFGMQDEDGVTFDEICCMFGWEPDYVRRIIRNLDKADMKMLEPSRFKEDFSRSCEEPDNPVSFRRWQHVDSAVPIVQGFLYGKDYRAPLMLRPIRWARPVVLTYPLVQWQGA
jgi:hypothetical protein